MELEARDRKYWILEINFRMKVWRWEEFNEICGNNGRKR